MNDNVNHPSSVITRFWKYIDVKKSDECWNWTGSIAKRGGYGQLNDRHKLLKSHRLSYEINHGKIPAKKHICHKCNNPRCCNPNHLYAGDNSTNTKDKIKAGTQYKIPAMKGEKCPASKLNWKDVIFIRESKLSGAELGRMFGISRTAACNIKNYKVWKSKA